MHHYNILWFPMFPRLGNVISSDSLIFYRTLFAFIKSATFLKLAFTPCRAETGTPRQGVTRKVAQKD